MSRYNSSGKFNIPWGHYSSVNFEAITDPRYYELLKNTDIRLCSFENIFEEFNSPDNFVFLDPPYEQGLLVSALLILHNQLWVEEGGLVVAEVEEAFDGTIPLPYEILDEKIYGDTKILFLRYASMPE